MATEKPDLTRVWANGAPPANVVDPDTTTPGKVLAGWQAEVPPFEHFNFLQKWFSQGLAHNNEQGINKWDANTVYPSGALVKGSNGTIYVALSEQNGNDPIISYNSWSTFKDATVDDFGAIGDGVTDDSVAINAMLAATGGYLKLNEKAYFIGNLSIIAYDKIIIEGVRKPSVKPDLSKLENGSILVGSVNIRANEIHTARWGLDNGSARAASGVDGIVANTKTGEVGRLFTAMDVSSLGPSEAGTTHGLLVQGFRKNIINRVYVGVQQFGIVVKGHNTFINDIDSDHIRTAAVYPKSDVPAIAGNVADGTVKTCQIANVQHRASASNVVASAVYIQASTDVLSGVQVVNVFQVNGRTPVRVQGGGAVSDPTISDIQVTQVRSDRCQEGFLIDGFVYDIQVSNIQTVNPATGRAITIGSNIFGWQVQNCHLVISDITITSTVGAQLRGTGVWDNFSVRNPYRDMEVSLLAADLSQIISGKVSGNIFITNEGELVGINGATSDTQTPLMSIEAGSIIKFSGRFDLTSSTNEFFCNLPINTGKQQVFACGGIDSGGEYQVIAVRLNGFQLSVEPSLPAGYSAVDISNISVNLRG